MELAQLATLDADAWEVTYGDFYQACAKGDGAISLADAFAMAGHGSPTVRSYGLLFMGALVDGGRLKPGDYNRIEVHVVGLLEGLQDYRVKDEEGRFIHFLSHAAFLADSLKPHRIGKIPAVLLNAYLRANEPLRMNEDVTVGDYLLTTLGSLEFAKTLERLVPGETGGVNAKALWLTMHALNATQNHQPP